MKNTYLQIGALAGLLVCATPLWADEFLISDTRDAYTRVQALSDLLNNVNQRIQAIQQKLQSDIAPFEAELQAARKQASTPATQKRKAELLLKIAELQKRAASAQRAVGEANETAVKEIEGKISEIEFALQKERGAKAVLRVQDTLYFNQACTCNITEEIYRRLNAQVKTIALKQP
jgi:Skp family chaperone for outer membrane proteins